MKIESHSLFCKTLFALSLSATLYSCAPTGLPGSGRKKMPEFTSYDGIEGAMPFHTETSSGTSAGAFAFATSNMDLDFNGGSQGFLAVSLPDATNDSLAISLLHSFKPYAIPMITSWARQAKQGVVIDLSSHSGLTTHRTDYMLESPNEFSVPVVVMWDQASVSRMATLQSLVQELPSMKLNYIAGFDPMKRR